jgi:hypothetical protein
MDLRGFISGGTSEDIDISPEVYISDYILRKHSVDFMGDILFGSFRL